MTTPGQLDRAAGAMVAAACGDALGAAYEFGGPVPTGAPIDMKGGGAFGWAPGEWTDDTSMAIPLLDLIESGERPRDANLGAVVRRWIDWMRTTKDVGLQTSTILRETAEVLQAVEAGERDDFGSDQEALIASAVANRFQERNPNAAGNGSLMRTTPYGLLNNDLWYVARTAYGQSLVTHPHIDAAEACALWACAINHAIRTAKLDVRVGLTNADAEISADRRQLWFERIAEAEAHPPEHFTRNGWVVQAFQGAWSAIVHSGDRSANNPLHVRRALEAAVRGGGDTDTVAAIAGGLIGASYGVSAIPLEWKRRIHGWPGWTADDLVAHAVAAQTHAGYETNDGWPLAPRVDYTSWGDIDAMAVHPHDAGVLIGGVGVLDRLPDEIDAVVSLCRMGGSQVPSRIPRENRVSVWLVDSPNEDSNQHVEFVLAEAADVVARLRAEGRRVFLHCVQAHSRTPTVAALYSARHLGIPTDRALNDVIAALPAANPNRRFRSVLSRASTMRVDDA